MTQTDLIVPWIALVVSGLGLIVNGIVLHKATVTVNRIRSLGINGETQRDSRWARWQDATLVVAQVVVFLSAVWMSRLPPAREEVSEHLQAAWLVMISLSCLLGSMGIRNLRLRHLHVQEYLARKHGTVRTRDTDGEWEGSDV